MPEWCIAIISVTIGAIVGALLGGFISRKNSIEIIKTQEIVRAKREFRKFFINLSARIKYNNFSNSLKLWENIRDYCVFSDEAINNIIPHLDSVSEQNITTAYNKYKQKDSANSVIYDDPFQIYDIDEYCAIKSFNFRHKNGKEYALYNIQQIIDIAK